MATQLRETHFGYLARFVSRKKLFAYPDEIDPSLWRKSVERDTQSTPTSLEGHQDGSKEKPPDDANDSRPSHPLNSTPRNMVTQGQNINHIVEEGKDVYLVDWYGQDDPEVYTIIIHTHRHYWSVKTFCSLAWSQQNPQNWPSGFKLLVGFQVCIMNFAFYMASSIYVPGEPSFMEEFGVGEVVATLGLSLFTA